MSSRLEHFHMPGSFPLATISFTQFRGLTVVDIWVIVSLPVCVAPVVSVYIVLFYRGAVVPRHHCDSRIGVVVAMYVCISS